MTDALLDRLVADLLPVEAKAARAIGIALSELKSDDGMCLVCEAELVEQPHDDGCFVGQMEAWFMLTTMTVRNPQQGRG